jgi:hypothetical protein
MLQSMETAPLDRAVIVRATRMVVGLGPIEEPPFDTQARFYPEHGFLGGGGQTSTWLAEFGASTAEYARLDFLK